MADPVATGNRHFPQRDFVRTCGFAARQKGFRNRADQSGVGCLRPGLDIFIENPTRRNITKSLKKRCPVHWPEKRFEAAKPPLEPAAKTNINSALVGRIRPGQELTSAFSNLRGLQRKVRQNAVRNSRALKREQRFHHCRLLGEPAIRGRSHDHRVFAGRPDRRMLGHRIRPCIDARYPDTACPA